MLRAYLQDQLYPDEDLSSDVVGLDNCLPLEDDMRLSVYHSARGCFYALSELAGNGGMHGETIRSNPSWYSEYERRDTALVQAGSSEDIMGGLSVARVRAFLSFEYDDDIYSCALVEWFSAVGDSVDPLTGMWLVTPDKSAGRRALGVIHLDCIFRSCMLIGLTNAEFLPKEFKYSGTHTSFRTFYLNKFADYHSHETLYVEY